MRIGYLRIAAFPKPLTVRLYAYSLLSKKIPHHFTAYNVVAADCRGFARQLRIKQFKKNSLFVIKMRIGYFKITAFPKVAPTVRLYAYSLLSKKIPHHFTAYNVVAADCR